MENRTDENQIMRIVPCARKKMKVVLLIKYLTYKFFYWLSAKYTFGPVLKYSVQKDNKIKFFCKQKKSKNDG